MNDYNDRLINCKECKGPSGASLAEIDFRNGRVYFIYECPDCGNSFSYDLARETSSAEIKKYLNDEKGKYQIFVKALNFAVMAQKSKHRKYFDTNDYMRFHKEVMEPEKQKRWWQFR